MHTSQWTLALQIQFGISLAAIVLAPLVYGVRLRTALLVAAIVFFVPVATVPGFATWLYPQDFMVPIFSMLVILNLRELHGKLFWMGALSLLLVPMVSTLLGAYLNIGERYAWITFLYRRYGFVLFFAFGACGMLRKTKAVDFMDALVLIWTMMAAVGILQYLGVLSTDFQGDAGEKIISVSESFHAQRGFLGLRRAGIALLSGGMASYCLALVLLDRSIDSRRSLLYTACTILSVGVMLFSGSRTGFLAIAAAFALIAWRSLRLMHNVKAGRAVVFAVVAVLGVMFFMAKGGAVVSDRLDYGTAFESGSFQGRLHTQGQLLRVVFTDPRAIIVGIGGGSNEEFAWRLMGLSHAHNDYLQFLWEAGIPGFVLFLAFLYTVWRSMRPVVDGQVRILAIAAQGILVIGLVMGLTEGHLASTSARLGPVGMLLLLAYGLLSHDLAYGGRELIVSEEDSNDIQIRPDFVEEYRYAA